MKETTYILHWLGGKTETIHGFSIEDAMTKAGYGAGALLALDWYEREKDHCPFCGQHDSPAQKKAAR